MKNILKRYRYSTILLRQLVITDFKLRYQGSVLGYLWSLLRPLALFAILYVVFAKFLRLGDSIPHFPIYLLIGIVLWNYFSEVTSNSISSIVGKGDLIRKINFPKYVMVLAGSFSALINLFLNLFVVAVFMLINNVEIRVDALAAVLLIVELFVFSLAIAFFLAAVFVKFRDINYIWEVIMQGAFYATPIIYPLSLIPDNAAKILLLNPMAQIIQDIRYVLVTPKTQTLSDFYESPLVRFIPLGLCVLFAVLSIWYFKSRSRYFAEEV